MKLSIKSPLSRLVLFTLAIVLNSFDLHANPGPNTSAQRIILQFQHKEGLRQDFAAYTRHDQVYVPIVRLFDQLSVKIDYNPDTDFLTGFFLLPEQVYSIDLRKNEGIYGANSVQFERQAYIKAGDDIFLDIEVLNDLFELGLQYEPRDLKVRMRNSHVFPYMQRQKRQILRNNQLEASRLSDSLMSQASTLMADKRFYAPGITNWRFSNSFTGSRQNIMGTAVHGGILAGGDYRIRAGGMVQSQDYGFINGRWRKVNSDNRWLRQIQIGTSIDQPGHPVRQQPLEGLYITNYEPVNHRTFTRYELEADVRQNREIALYHNQRLVDYRQTDKSGEVSFEVPLGYGSHDVALRMYGPYGEYREEVRYLRIPSKMVPAGAWRYELAAGNAVAGSAVKKVGKRGVSWSGGYGVTDEVTLKTGGFHWWGRRSPQLYLNLLWNFRKQHFLGGAVTNDAEWMGSWSYRQPSKWGFRVRYERRNSDVINFVNSRAPERISWLTEVNRSWQYRSLSGNTYLTHRAITYRQRGSGNLRAGVNLQWRNFRGRLEPGWTYRIEERQIKRVTPGTRASVGIPLVRGTRMRLRSEWNHWFKSLSNVGVRLHKRINPWWQASVGGTFHERGRWSASAGVRLTLPFSRVNSQVHVSGAQWNLRQQMGGSFWYNRDRQRLYTARQSWSQKGKVEFKPFLDTDRDGIKNESERWIEGDQMIVASNSTVKSAYGGKTDNLYQAYKEQGFAVELQPFSEYRVSNKYRMVQVKPFPHIINLVPIPMIIQGTLSGQVRKPVSDWEGREPTHWKVLVIHNSTGETDTLRTLPSGRFYHSSLSQGKYTIQLLPDQLERYKLTSEPARYQVAVEAQEGKRRITDLHFSLKQDATK